MCTEFIHIVIKCNIYYTIFSVFWIGALKIPINSEEIVSVSDAIIVVDDML